MCTIYRDIPRDIAGCSCCRSECRASEQDRNFYFASVISIFSSLSCTKKRARDRYKPRLKSNCWKGRMGVYECTYDGRLFQVAGTWVRKGTATKKSTVRRSAIWFLSGCDDFCAVFLVRCCSFCVSLSRPRAVVRTSLDHGLCCTFASRVFECRGNLPFSGFSPCARFPFPLSSARRDLLCAAFFFPTLTLHAGWNMTVDESDLGLAKRVTRKTGTMVRYTMTSRCGTIRYMAPEVGSGVDYCGRRRYIAWAFVVRGYHVYFVAYARFSCPL